MSVPAVTDVAERGLEPTPSGNTGPVTPSTPHPPHAAGIHLEGVSETTLWTLYHRAAEASRPDCVLHDPMAVELVHAIDFPFEERFGASTTWSQWQALRARTFDREIRRFLHDHPEPTVVALGEGLETQFWRVNDGRVHWVSVDLPAVIELRRRLLPDPPNIELVESSVGDGSWLDAVGPSTGVLVTAQGLLMYLERRQVHELIGACADRFAQSALLFDAVPRWLSERTRSSQLETRSGYRPPPWTWGLDAGEVRSIAGQPGVAELRRMRVPGGRGPLFGVVLPAVNRVPRIADAGLSIWLARLAGHTPNLTTAGEDVP
jgi:O-methyltransferase involved in polyketide biosynthesis